MQSIVPLYYAAFKPCNYVLTTSIGLLANTEAAPATAPEARSTTGSGRWTTLFIFKKGRNSYIDKMLAVFEHEESNSLVAALFQDSCH
jgi:hypothetical protein